MTALVTGATGLLGSHLAAAFARRGEDAAYVGLTSLPSRPDESWHRCDLSDESEVDALWQKVAPTLVIHAAALTDVDLCEREPETADRVNRRTTELLAQRAAANDARLVLISTDSVFDGVTGGYGEDAVPFPVNVYARSKLAAEREAAFVADHLVLRTNFFGRSTRGHGLAEWLIRRLEAREEIVGFTDVCFSPLWCDDVATYALDLGHSDVRGILHLGGADAVTKLEFAKIVADAYGLDGSAIRPGRLSEVGLAAPRPHNTSLDSSAAASLVGPLPTVEESVRRMVSRTPATASER